MILALLISIAGAQTFGCAPLLTADVATPLTTDEVLARGQVGPQVFTRDGREVEVFVSVGLPEYGGPHVSVERSYASPARARRTANQLMYLRDEGWPVTEVRGLAQENLILAFTEGPAFAQARATSARPDTLDRALAEFFGDVGAWARGRRIRVTREGDELRVRGRSGGRALKFKLRPEHFSIDVPRGRLLITDLDAD